MKILIMFLLFVYAFCSTDYYDIQLNKQYDVDMTQFPYGYIPSDTYFSLRAAISEVTLNQFEFHLQATYNSNMRFSIEICTYNEIDQNTNCLDPSIEVELDSNYKKYIYSFTVNDDSQYLLIDFTNLEPLDYLSYSLNTEKGEEDEDKDEEEDKDNKDEEEDNKDKENEKDDEEKESMEFAITENAIPYKKEYQFDESLKNKTLFFLYFENKGEKNYNAKLKIKTIEDIKSNLRIPQINFAFTGLKEKPNKDMT